MSGHTPGPWLVEGRTVYALNDDGYNRFSALVQDAHTPGDELEANARLIAAAPELLEALEDIANDYAERFDMDSQSTNPGMKVVVENARAAIAKARGTPC